MNPEALVQPALSLGIAAEASTSFQSAALKLSEEASALDLPSWVKSASHFVKHLAERSGHVSETVQYPLRNLAEQRDFIRFSPNGLAQVRENGIRTVQPYRLFGDRFFLYRQEQTPKEISATLRPGFLSGENFVDSYFDREIGVFNMTDPNERFYADLSSIRPQHDWANWSVNQIKTAEEAISLESLPFGVGYSRQAWLTPEGNAIVVGRARTRPNCEFLLPRLRDLIEGDKQFEWFLPGDSSAVTIAELNELHHRARLAGWEFNDNAPANYVKTEDGKVWRVDPDCIWRVTS